MKTQAKPLFEAIELLDKGAIVLIDGDKIGTCRLHSYTRDTNPMRINCKLEREGQYHKEFIGGHRSVIVITGE